MDKELKRQRIRSLIEDGGYADIPESRQHAHWWRWLAAAASLALIFHLVVDLMSKAAAVSM